MSIPHFIDLFPELLEIVLDNIDARRDLLSLALSCTRFSAVIIPERLNHHTIVASPYHAPLWAHLAANPRLARYVHSLTVYDDPRQAFPPKYGWRQPSSLSDLTCQYTVGQYDVELITTALRSMTNVTRLNLRYARTAHLRAAMPCLPNTLAIVFSNLTSLEHVSTSTRLSPADEEALCDPNHPLWTMKDLKTLDLDVSGPGEYLWPAFASILVASPSLEDLRLPDFLDEKTMAQLCQLRFPALRRLDRAYAWSLDLTPHIVTFLRAHPTIEVLRWPTLASAPLPADALPALMHLSAPNATFLTRFLESRGPRSVRLRALTDVPLTAELAAALVNKLEPGALATLHLDSLDDYASLRALAPVCAGLTALRIPRRGAWRENARFATRLMHAVLRPWFRDLQLPRLVDIARMFPALEDVEGVRCLDRVEDVARDGGWTALRRVNGVCVQAAA
ncbi:hypothetical protein K488DRAFT_70991 [Vararia minispora EC-137]|uniref:Uncharacterized protein n=1 Tax=Vararia minispora EC-137 TaxID=1314806 RepID=A0ACB8QKW0_9AGAM|nr:hypothetical protein K488DRAFT_70991 [Vararia minispora EC-137]